MTKLSRKKLPYSLVLFLVGVFSLGTVAYPLGTITRHTYAILASRTTTISSSTQLVTALKNAKSGDTIILTDGTYADRDFVIDSKKGTSTSPIIIKAAHKNRAVISGSAGFTITNSSYITIDGIEFANSGRESILVVNSPHTTIRNNIFHQKENGKQLNWVFIKGTGGYNRIERNLFENKKNMGKFLAIDSADQKAALKGNVILYNHFRNIGPFQGNGKEAIRIGQDNFSYTTGETKIEYNLFENCTGDGEVVSVKSSNNILRFNTFRNNIGALTLRSGDNNQVYGNFFLGGEGGVRVTGANHLIFNNYFEGLTGDQEHSALYMRNGDVEVVPRNIPNANYGRPKNITIAFNTFVNNDYAMVLGAKDYGDLAPKDLTIANNIIVDSKKSILILATKPISSTWSGNIFYPEEAAANFSAQSLDVRTIDPLLENRDGIYRLSPDSPARDASYGNYTSFLNRDMDGQDRDAHSDVGADEYSPQNTSRRPLQADMVGPFSE